jgi:hypothetical protein
METALMITASITMVLAMIAAYCSFRCCRRTAEILARVERALAWGDAGGGPASPKVLFERQISLHPNQAVSRLDINLGAHQAKKQ